MSTCVIVGGFLELLPLVLLGKMPLEWKLFLLLFFLFSRSQYFGGGGHPDLKNKNKNVLRETIHTAIIDRKVL